MGISYLGRFRTQGDFVLGEISWGDFVLMGVSYSRGFRTQGDFLFRLYELYTQLGRNSGKILTQ